MIEIDVSQYTSASDAYDAGEAAYIAANPEPVQPEKTVRFSRPVLITARKKEHGRLWVEAKQDISWGNEPNDPHFYLRSHEVTDLIELEAGEIRVLIEQLTLKLEEFEQAAAWKAEFKAWQSNHRKWEEQKQEAGDVARALWRKAQQQLKPLPEPNDYTDDDIDEDDYEEDDDEDEEF